MRGIDKYVTESMQTKEEDHRASGRPQLKPAVTRYFVSVPVRDRTWIGVIKCQKT